MLKYIIGNIVRNVRKIEDTRTVQQLEILIGKRAQEARGALQDNQIKTRLYKTRHAALIPPTLPPEIEYSSTAIRTRNRIPFTANSPAAMRRNYTPFILVRCDFTFSLYLSLFFFSLLLSHI